MCQTYLTMMIICKYDKIQWSKNKWKFCLKGGIVFWRDRLYLQKPLMMQSGKTYELST